MLRLDNRLHSLVRTDAVARILAEGMVGARVVEISPGGKDSPVVAEGGIIGSEPPLELTDLMKRTSVSLAPGRFTSHATTAPARIGVLSSIGRYMPSAKARAEIPSICTMTATTAPIPYRNHGAWPDCMTDEITAAIAFA